jgi:hypothetical protein
MLGDCGNKILRFLLLQSFRHLKRKFDGFLIGCGLFEILLDYWDLKGFYYRWKFDLEWGVSIDYQESRNLHAFLWQGGGA